MAENMTDDSSASGDADDIRMRKPQATDGAAVSGLIADCPPLDENSMYCNLLQCTDFADTCILAELDGEPVGWISAYRPPTEPETLFVWQVAVHEKARGRGLAGRMLNALLERPDCDGVDRITTTVTPDNEASLAMFRSFARRADAPLEVSEGFDRTEHFDGQHKSERLITIGPIPGREQANAGSRPAA